MPSASFSSVVLAIVVGVLTSPAPAADPPPLVLSHKIALGDTSGRIDHMSVDRARQRLFVAELGNDRVGVVDLKARAVSQRITSVKEPQGVLYVPGADRLFVASGDNGSVYAFRGDDFTPAGRLDFKSDADNLRLDPDGKRVWVGYGSGALAAFDAVSLQKVSEIPLKEHPESFQIEADGARIFANVPDSHEVAVVNRAGGKQIASWKPEAGSNFPMSFADGKLAVVARSPARLIIFDTATGRIAAALPTCGDADDVFHDGSRQRLYISCGSGSIDIFDVSDTTPVLKSRVETSSGARTSFFDPEADLLYLAVRAGLTTPAEIWVYQPK